MQAHELEEALAGTSSAKGSEAGLDLPANCETVMEVASYTVAVNKKNGSKTNGQLFFALNGPVISCTNSQLPVGANARVAYFGLNSPVNQGSLANENKEAVRKCTAALLGKDASQPPFPGKTWEQLIGSIAGSQDGQKFVVGKRVRIVTGPANANGYTKKQFFAA